MVFGHGHTMVVLCALQAIESGSRREERSLVLLRRVLLWVTITIVILGTASAVIEGRRSASLQRKGMLIFREGERAALQQVGAVPWTTEAACRLRGEWVSVCSVAWLVDALHCGRRCVLCRCCFARRSP